MRNCAVWALIKLIKPSWTLFSIDASAPAMEHVVSRVICQIKGRDIVKRKQWRRQSLSTSWLSTCVGAAVIYALVPSAGYANTLHGFCSAGCADNGTNTPITSNPPVNFGFTSSPAGTGDLRIEVLIPDNISGAGPFSITGAASATATLFSSTPWTSGQLDAYLGISASPANPVGAYLPSTQTFQPTATGFFVFQADVSIFTLPAPGGTPPLFSLTGPVAKGAYLVGFFNTGSPGIPDWGATANSGALFVVPGPVVGAGLPGLVAACGGLIALARRRRRAVM